MRRSAHIRGTNAAQRDARRLAMTDPFLRDAHGTPCGLSRPAPIEWTVGARALMTAYVARLSDGALVLQAHRLQRRAEAAVRSQQYRTVTETTVRAQIAQLAEITTEGDTRR